MRVTKNMMISSFLNDIQRAEERNLRNQRRISTGLEVEKPSDDPAAATRILYLRSKVSKVQQYQENIDHVALWTTNTANILQNVYDLFLRAQDLAIAGGDETINHDQRSEMAEEVNQLLETLAKLANEKIEDYYAFGGNYIDGEPFIITRGANNEITGVTLDVQEGIDVQRIEEVLEGKTETVNELGTEVFTSGALDYFQTLIDLRDNLRTVTTDMTPMAISLDQVKDVLAATNVDLDRVGGKERWLRAVQMRLEDAEFEYDKTRAGLEEADLTQAIMDYQRDQYIYQATLAVGARSFSPTLVDFLS